MIRPVGKLSELSTYPQICQQVRTLTEAGWAATAIAQVLSDAGYCPAHATVRFGAQTIRKLQRQLAVRAPRPRVRPRDGLLPNEWWKASLVRMLDIPRASLYHWICQGLVRARQLDEPLHRWVVWADEAEQERLRQYHQRHWGRFPPPLDGCTPCRITLLRISYKRIKKGCNNGNHSETENDSWG